MRAALYVSVSTVDQHTENQQDGLQRSAAVLGSSATEATPTRASPARRNVARASTSVT
jgi:DNA invertase Pin-like site-specific DNA recombinase